MTKATTTPDAAPVGTSLSPLAPMTALVIAAGSSKRLGRPKQLLDFRGATLLDATLANVRTMPCEQRIVTIGAAADEIYSRVDLSGFTPIESVNSGQGCSSSIVSALRAVEPTSAGVMLFLGDQPDIDPTVVTKVAEVGQDHPIVVCDYADGIGHPFWFRRDTFGALSGLHGDKAIWKLIESGQFEVERVPVSAPTPLDVDTEDDYDRLLAFDG